MKERPIIFSTPMVRAILDGRKTQTRRIIKPQFVDHSCPRCFRAYEIEDGKFGFENEDDRWPCPYGRPGDLLWVRETFFLYGFNNKPIYKADFSDYQLNSMRSETSTSGLKFGNFDFHWKPSIHMPKQAARIWLKITDIRVDRLQDISEKDAKAEGVEPIGVETGRIDAASNPEEVGCYIIPFSKLWNSINATRAPRDSNPWVWVVSFERTAKP